MNRFVGLVLVFVLCPAALGWDLNEFGERMGSGFHDNNLTCFQSELSQGLKKVLSVKQVDIYNVHFSLNDRIRNRVWNKEQSQKISIVGSVSGSELTYLWCTLTYQNNEVTFTNGNCKWTHPDTGRRMAIFAFPNEGAAVAVPACPPVLSQESTGGSYSYGR